MIGSLVRNSLIGFTLFAAVNGHAATEWEPIEEGLSYTTIHLPEMNAWATIHAYRINLARWPLDLALAKDFNRTSMTANQFIESTQAILAVNGGFFDQSSSPLGLRIRQQKTLQPLKKISWWGVFSIRQNQPMIQSLSEYQKSAAPDLAVQAGPRLVVHGALVKQLKAGLAERTGIGINAKQEVIIAVTESTPMSLDDFAKVFQKSESADGLGCTMALNLDGGGSTQLYGPLPQQGTLNLPGYSQVSDAIIIRSHPR